MLVDVSAFAASQIPNLETSAASDERDLVFKVEALTKLIRQEKAALLIERSVLRLRMQPSQKNSQVALGYALHCFGLRADFFEFARRHDDEELTVCFRHHDQILTRTVPPPPRRNGDAIFVIDLMTKLACIKNRIS